MILLPQVDLQWAIRYSAYIGLAILILAGVSLILIAWWEDLNR